MTAKKNNQYIAEGSPLVTPGHIIAEYLESMNMTTDDFAKAGLPKKTVSEIINAKRAITPAIALILEKVLGRPAHFWSNLERNYQEKKARAEERKNAKTARKSPGGALVTAYNQQ